MVVLFPFGTFLLVMWKDHYDAIIVTLGRSSIINLNFQFYQVKVHRPDKLDSTHWTETKAYNISAKVFLVFCITCICVFDVSGLYLDWCGQTAAQARHVSTGGRVSLQPSAHWLCRCPQRSWTALYPAPDAPGHTYTQGIIQSRIKRIRSLNDTEIWCWDDWIVEVDTDINIGQLK